MTPTERGKSGGKNEERPMAERTVFDYDFLDGGALDAPKNDRERIERWGEVGMRYKRERDETREALRAMTAARDHCKQQTADVDELRQWQVNHATVALQAIQAHGTSGVWTAEDCATQAIAALERMRSSVGSVPRGMQDPANEPDCAICKDSEWVVYGDDRLPCHSCRPLDYASAIKATPERGGYDG